MADDKLKLRAREVARKFLDSPEWYDLERDDDEATAIGRLLAAFAAELVAEARVEEAKWLEQYLHNGHTRDCTFDNATGDEGDYCSCGMAQRRADVSKHLAELEATLASLRTPQAKGGR